MLEWIIGAAIVGAIVAIARSNSSSSDSSSSGSTVSTMEAPVFAAAPSMTSDCKAVVDKWVSALDADSQVLVAKALSEGDSTAIEGFAAVVDGANPTLAACIRSMKPKIVGLPPVISGSSDIALGSFSSDATKSTSLTSSFDLSPAIASSLFKPAAPLTSAQLLAALNTCLAGSGMSADLQNHTIEVFKTEPTRGKLALIADALRSSYPAVAGCIDAIPA